MAVFAGCPTVLQAVRAMSNINYAQYAEPVARALCGEVNTKLSKAGELRFGTNGSLKVKIEGPEAGTFSNFETGEAGGLLDLIALHRGGDRREAHAWLSEQYGLERTSRGKIVGKKIVAVYRYEDEAGERVFEAVRMEGRDPDTNQRIKVFFQRKDENTYGVKGCRVVPYRLPELMEAIAQERPVFVVEGEKDVDRLAKLGVVATCNSEGAGKWKPQHSEFLEGADVVILPDNDEPGQKHAQTVARSLKAKAARIRIAELPDLPNKGDVSDWLAKGNTVERLYEIVESASDWQPASTLGLVWMGEQNKLPPRKWLVKGLLGEGELSVMYAPSGGGKSFVALDLGARIAAGLDWYDHRVTPSAVLYVAGEGATGFRQRMTAWQDRNGVDELPFVMMPRAIDLFSKDNKSIDLIGDAMTEIQERAGLPVRLIVLDTLSRMMHGGVDSEPRDMKIFLEHVEALRQATGAHILIIHHTGKETDRGMRGSSMLRDFADTVLAIEAPKEEDTDHLHWIKVDKQKDGEDGGKYRARLSQSTVGTDEDGDETTSCVVEHLGASETTGPAKPQKRLSPSEEIARRALADLLCDQGVTPRDSRIPPSVTHVVTLEAWKDEFRRRGDFTDPDQARADARFRQAWKRTHEGLITKGLAMIMEGQAWLV
ncbi:AAA family ATPase [Fulvimarina sp. MAC3]|uniref:AAA family ATPase n=1 Tax=Fulvimarina sp. MAC3 TaxID=3148887 RepID=UPI0031FDCCBD